MSHDFDHTDPLNNARKSGPWPFTTRISSESDGKKRVWHSRNHRKGLQPDKPDNSDGAGKWLWAPQKLNWWIGVIFAVGSALFAIASVLSLSPALATSLSLGSNINAMYFAGSIPFTFAAWLQLFQAANANNPLEETKNESKSHRRKRVFGWKPKEIGWLSAALQFVGTVLFNVNTFDAMLPSLDWLQQDLAIWAPDFVGSILFLVSGYLAFIETCHAHWDWQLKSLSWWVVFINLLGCVGFMISAVFAIVLPGTPSTFAIFIATMFTLLGAVCFLVGSLLMLRE